MSVTIEAFLTNKRQIYDNSYGFEKKETTEYSSKTRELNT
jgi:hypothetical protein